MAGIIAQLIVRLEPGHDHVQVRERTPGDMPSSLWIRTEGGGLVQLQFRDTQHMHKWLSDALAKCPSGEARRAAG